MIMIFSAPRVVPSRYLQAASNSKGPIKATDKVIAYNTTHDTMSVFFCYSLYWEIEDMSMLSV